MFNRDPSLNNEEQLMRMSHVIRHRGPDESDFIVRDSFCAAFRRLSIIDLDHGSQPYTSPDGRFTAVFNGEIYNYRDLRAPLQEEGIEFFTNSEIEVIVALYRKYGPDFVKMLRGMFAIMIYDGDEKNCFVCRDPFGIKPLYYREEKDRVVFASEMKAFIFDEEMGGFDVDNKSLQNYFTFQYVPEPKTMTGKVRALEASHYMMLSASGIEKVVQYEDYRFQTPSKETFEAKAEKLRKVLTESVEYHMISDVEVGTFLSSGIDSAVVTAISSRINPGIKALTVGFDVSSYSEIDDASEIAKHLNVEHIKLKGTCEQFRDAFEHVVWSLDSPVADPSTVAIYMIAGEASRYVKTILSGEGADELFGGYKFYLDSKLSGRFENAPAVFKAACRGISDIWPKGVKGKAFFHRAGTKLEDR